VTPARARDALYPVGSVGKALALLQLLHDRKTLRVTEVSRELNVALSTAHRLLAMFEQFGFLDQHERNSVYTIGPALVEIATSIAGHLDIETALRPHLNDLVREINETALLCIVRGTRTVFLDAVESTHGLRATSQAGRSIPAHATAGGKALLAEYGADEICRLYPNEDLGRLTPKTHASRTALLLELRRIRERGFALDVEESELHFVACASVVRDRAGVARAAIVVAGPAARMSRYDPGRIPAAVRAACANATAAITSASAIGQRDLGATGADGPAAGRRRE
jgi:DNA-binding IclR family transcriptional regulator